MSPCLITFSFCDPLPATLFFFQSSIGLLAAKRSSRLSQPLSFSLPPFYLQFAHSSLIFILCGAVRVNTNHHRNTALRVIPHINWCRHPDAIRFSLILRRYLDVGRLTNVHPSFRTFSFPSSPLRLFSEFRFSLQVPRVLCHQENLTLVNVDHRLFFSILCPTSELKSTSALRAMQVVCLPSSHDGQPSCRCVSSSLVSSVIFNTAIKC